MNSVRTVEISSAAGATTRVMPALATLTFGVFVLFVVGFLQTPVAHNAALDTRHANGLRLVTVGPSR